MNISVIHTHIYIKRDREDVYVCIRETDREREKGSEEVEKR